ncbi:MAG: nucleotidyltransferase domain-containing protein [Candidatus Gracilibacteria bacterium]|nr:nucleotidyltransferase domain-containing protein [bacterium]MDZ4217213.1 nucleotidyltransferase domain-containing protein [Candidatus Gracilibacteria bacterium]
MSKILKHIRDTIVREYNPDKIILFGSRVWGKPNKWSDYDLLVVKKGTRKRLYERSGELTRMLRQKNIWEPLDIFVYNQQEFETIRKREDQLFTDILSKGKTLYEKQ